jgi:hypothetical protein
MQKECCEEPIAQQSARAGNGAPSVQRSRPVEGGSRGPPTASNEAAPFTGRRSGPTPPHPTFGRSVVPSPIFGAARWAVGSGGGVDDVYTKDLKGDVMSLVLTRRSVCPGSRVVMTSLWYSATQRYFSQKLRLPRCSCNRAVTTSRCIASAGRCVDRGFLIARSRDEDAVATPVCWDFGHPTVLCSGRVSHVLRSVRPEQIGPTRTGILACTYHRPTPLSRVQPA